MCFSPQIVPWQGLCENFVFGAKQYKSENKQTNKQTNK